MIPRWTPLVLISPRWGIDTDHDWHSVDLHEWADRYQWEQDGFNGLLDLAADPVETYRTERGDCEDFALVCASWLEAHNKPWGLAGMWSTDIVPEQARGHVVAFDTERVYSSGEIVAETVAETVDRLGYDVHLTRWGRRP